MFSPYSDKQKLHQSLTCQILSVADFQLAKLFADLSTMTDMALPTTPQVSTYGSTSFPQIHNRKINMPSAQNNNILDSDKMVIHHQVYYFHLMELLA